MADFDHLSKPLKLHPNGTNFFLQIHDMLKSSLKNSGLTDFWENEYFSTYDSVPENSTHKKKLPSEHFFLR